MGSKSGTTHHNWSTTSTIEVTAKARRWNHSPTRGGHPSQHVDPGCDRDQVEDNRSRFAVRQVKNAYGDKRRRHGPRQAEQYPPQGANEMVTARDIQPSLVDIDHP
jgi:hypothetical protein